MTRNLCRTHVQTLLRVSGLFGAMDSKYEGKINPPKEPDMGVAKARMSRPTGPDRKEMAYNRRRSASEGRTVSKMAMGGKCRGMGAATKGGSFSKNG
jgi:hypothetical protein